LPGPKKIPTKWEKGRGTHEAVPYLLPELIASRQADRTLEVYVVEGEREAELLKGWGLVATSVKGAFLLD
jgi:hypothetical protein